jgi:hypothetical protein
LREERGFDCDEGIVLFYFSLFMGRVVIGARDCGVSLNRELKLDARGSGGRETERRLLFKS